MERKFNARVNQCAGAVRRKVKIEQLNARGRKAGDKRGLAEVFRKLDKYRACNLLDCRPTAIEQENPPEPLTHPIGLGGGVDRQISNVDQALGHPVRRRQWQVHRAGHVDQRHAVACCHYGIDHPHHAPQRTRSGHVLSSSSILLPYKVEASSTKWYNVRAGIIERMHKKQGR